MQFRGGSQIQILFDQGLLNLKIQIQSVQNFLTNDTLRDIERYVDMCQELRRLGALKLFK